MTRCRVAELCDEAGSRTMLLIGSFKGIDMDLRLLSTDFLQTVTDLCRLFGDLTVQDGI